MGEIIEHDGKPQSFGVQLKNRESQFVAALPSHVPVERFIRVVMTAVQNNPKLAMADRATLWTASMKAAQDGLLPDGREGALVIYSTKKDNQWVDAVQWMPMIAGIRKKVRNSGEIATWNTEVVHELDEFDFQKGDDPFIRHKPSMAADPGPVIAAYSIAVLKSGEKSREVMTISELNKVRNSSKSKEKGPWVDWFEEMCRKTVARRHSKVLPMSTDMDDLIRRDDDLYDMKGASDTTQAPRPAVGLTDRLDALSITSGNQQDSETTKAKNAAADANDAEEGKPSLSDRAKATGPKPASTKTKESPAKAEATGGTGSSAPAGSAASSKPTSNAPREEGEGDAASRKMDIINALDDLLENATTLEALDAAFDSQEASLEAAGMVPDGQAVYERHAERIKRLPPAGEADAGEGEGDEGDEGEAGEREDDPPFDPDPPKEEPKQPVIDPALLARAKEKTKRGEHRFGLYVGGLSMADQEALKPIMGELLAEAKKNG